MEPIVNEQTCAGLQNNQYRARVVDHELTQTFMGTDQMEVIFELQAIQPKEEDEEEDTSVQGVKVHAALFFTDKTVDRTIESLRHCGWTGDNLENLLAEGFGTKEVSLDMEWQLYKGAKVYRVKWVNPIGGIKPKPLAGDQVRGLAALVKSRIQQGAGSPDARKNRTERAPSPAAGGHQGGVGPRRGGPAPLDPGGFDPEGRYDQRDDDIPF